MIVMWKLAAQCLFIMIMVATCYGKDKEPAENRLHHELLHLRSYSNLIRPVSNNSVQLIVKIGLRLSQLLDMVSCLKNRGRFDEIWHKQYNLSYQKLLQMLIKLKLLQKYKYWVICLIQQLEFSRLMNLEV